MTTEAVKILKMDDDTAVVGGYGVVWGGTDLQGDTFTQDTDFMLDRIPVKIVMYDHGMTAVKNFLGDVPNDNIKADDKGLWVEAQLDRSREYVNEVLKLIEAGALGYSSGSVGHLVQRAQKNITRWPIVEFSLTPTPAEPRTVGVQRIKSLAEQDERFQAFLPEGGGEPSGDATPETEGEAKNHTQEGNDMTTEVKNETPVIETAPSIDAIKSAFGDAIKPLQERIEKLEKQPATKSMPAVLTMERGDSEAHEIKAFLTGKTNQTEYELKASNATDMNIGTDADGGYAVPTGFYAQIIARRDQDMLANKLGVMRIPGVGTTVNVPLDAEADGEFVSTNEAAQFDLDAPALGVKAFTLVKYTKRMLVSYELLEDTPTAIESFLVNFVGRGLAKTHNNLLLTEVAANGTSFKTFAGASAIAFGEPEDILGNVDLSAYLDGGAAWVGRSSTYWDIMSIVGNDRQYGNAATAMGMGQNLLGYDFHFTDKAAAIAGGAKSLYFGNWSYVGWREAPGLTMIRNPYLRADYGQLALHFHFRTVYGVLQSEAIGYGEHPTA